MVLYIPLKASQAQLKVGPYSIFMKLALCEIGFCLMDPCMGAPPDTSASAYRHRSHTEDRETEQEKGQIKINKATKKIRYECENYPTLWTEKNQKTYYELLTSSVHYMYI